MEPPAKRKCMLPGYLLSLQDKDGRKHYTEMLMTIAGVDLMKFQGMSGKTM